MRNGNVRRRPPDLPGPSDQRLDGHGAHTAGNEGTEALGYCGGFAAGTWVGLVIEEKLALGYAVVRAISRDDGERIALALRKAGYELCWHSDAQAGDRAEPLQVQDINGDSHLKVLCVQAMDAVGQSLSPG